MQVTRGWFSSCPGTELVQGVSIGGAVFLEGKLQVSSGWGCLLEGALGLQSARGPPRLGGGGAEGVQTTLGRQRPPPYRVLLETQSGESVFCFQAESPHWPKEPCAALRVAAGGRRCTALRARAPARGADLRCFSR